MATLKEYLAAQEGYNAEIHAGVDEIKLDIEGQNATIAELKAALEAAGVPDPETQVLINKLAADGTTLAAKVKSVAEIVPPKAPPA